MVRLTKWLIHPLECFICIEVHAVLDRNPGPRYNTLHLQLIPGDLYSPHRAAPHTTQSFTFGLHCQIPTLIPVCQVGRQFVLFLMMVFGMTHRSVNPRPTDAVTWLESFIFGLQILSKNYKFGAMLYNEWVMAFIGSFLYQWTDHHKWHKDS